MRSKEAFAYSKGTGYFCSAASTGRNRRACAAPIWLASTVAITEESNQGLTSCIIDGEAVCHARAGSGSKASCRSALARPTASAGHSTGSRARTRQHQRSSAKRRRIIPHHWHQFEWFAQLLCCHPRETEHVHVIHLRSLKTRGLGRAAVSRPQSGHSTASDKHHLR